MYLTQKSTVFFIATDYFATIVCGIIDGLTLNGRTPHVGLIVIVDAIDFDFVAF